MKGPGGRYMPHRRAYFPRTWPLVLSGAVIVTPACISLHLSGLLSAVAGATVGFTLGSARLWWWRRRHPVISTQEYINDLRRSAPYN